MDGQSHRVDRDDYPPVDGLLIDDALNRGRWLPLARRDLIASTAHAPVELNGLLQLEVEDLGYHGRLKDKL